jgi:hypothetical protein
MNLLLCFSCLSRLQKLDTGLERDAGQAYRQHIVLHPSTLSTTGHRSEEKNYSKPQQCLAGLYGPAHGS